MLSGHDVITTRAEMAANLAASRLTVAELAERLELPEGRVGQALNVTGRPEDVWLLRDYLTRVAGDAAVPFTVLVEARRADAASWFPLRRIPTC